MPFENAECELNEKKSRFIGRMLRVASAAEAAERIAEIKRKHYDATHNVYAYILRDGGMRYSDDGEPQGTAGMPVLNVLQRENMSDSLCVVTRYFGGILLGAGGLSRAYTAAAKQALVKAGVAMLRPHRVLSVSCSYRDYQLLQNLLVNFGLCAGDISYDAGVYFFVPVPSERAEELQGRIGDATAGRAKVADVGEKYLPEKINKKFK